MADDFVIKKGDRREPIQRTLKGSDGNPVDLTTASSVKFLMRLLGSGTLKVNAAAAIVAPATNGVVRYNWGANDTDTSGVYEAEWEVTYGDATKQSFPNDHQIIVRIFDDLG